MTSQTATLPALSREALEALSAQRGEPDWLRALRRQAFETFERLPVPDQRTEGWRRTSLRGLPLDQVTPLLAPAPAAPDPAEAEADAAPAREAGASLSAFHNGRLVRQDTLDRGRVLDLQDALRDPDLQARIEQHFSKLVPADLDTFTALHYAFFNAGVVIVIPRGVALEAPLWLQHVFDDRPESAALVHTLVLLEDEAEVAVVEDYRGGPGIASGVVEQVLGNNAHLRYVHLQRWGRTTWNFSAQRAQLGRDAWLRTLNVVLGAELARNTVQVALAGRGSQADLLAIASGDGRQQVDFETLQDHVADATRSDLVIHDALRGRSSANFTGLIRINPSARQTASSQEQKNLLLSDYARANSDPKLEILNNDVVRCTHGAAVGPVDEELVFYLQSRGLDRPSAEQLIVDGFFRSVLDKLEAPAVQEAVWAVMRA